MDKTATVQLASAEKQLQVLSSQLESSETLVNELSREVCTKEGESVLDELRAALAIQRARQQGVEVSRRDIIGAERRRTLYLPRKIKKCPKLVGWRY